MTHHILLFRMSRYRKQREEQKVVVRCQQKNGGGGTVPANLLQGIAPTRSAGINLDDVDGVFYDELISYPTHYRTPQPPAYEVIIFYILINYIIVI